MCKVHTWCVMTHSYMYHMTYSYIWHGSCIYVTWRIQTMRLTPQLYLPWTNAHNIGTCASWLIHICNTWIIRIYVRAHLYMTWLVHISVCRDSFTYVTHESFVYMWHDLFTHVTWRISSISVHVCHDSFMHVTYDHSYLWQGSFIYVTWLIHICDVAHSYMCHESSRQRS